MAVLVLTNASIVVNGVDLSDHCKQVTITYQAQPQTVTAFGQTTDVFAPGLINWQIDAEFYGDWGAGKTDATLFPLLGPGVAAFTIEVRPVNAARSTTNPGYNATAMLADYPPLGTPVGSVVTAKAVFKPAGASPTLLRSTS